MESSRDSSVWRNLAVTFGGGLALGAVGMKLTQTALRPLEAPPQRPEPNPMTDRLINMERRLEKVEHAPAPARPTPAQPAPPAMDQKVLEAVIGAVDARLHEHAGQVDRRLADVEARMAVMQSVQQQDRQEADQVRREAEQIRQEASAIRTALEQDMRQVRESVSRTISGQNATTRELLVLRQQHEQIIDGAEQRFADMRQEYRQGIAELRTEMEQSLETRFVTAAAASAAAQMEEQLAPLRAEVERKERELAELRQRLAESEKSVLDVVLAIGAVCRQAADRIGGAKDAGPSAPPVAAAPVATARPRVEPPPLAPPEAVAIAPTPASAPRMETLTVPQAASEPALTAPPPDFLQEPNHRGNWRIPLVSSVLVSTGYLVLMHYLSASLQ